MSVSKVSNRWLNRLYKCLAIFLVAFAVVISAFRLLLPYAHNYRVELQDYINTTYGSNIIIGRLQMDWQRSGPILVAENISLLQTDSTEVYLQALNIELDFWQTLKAQRLITKDLSMEGVKVLFDRSLLEREGINSQDLKLIDNISELFLTQINRFSVLNSQVIVRSEKGERTFLVNQLHWLNYGGHHKARGDVIVDGLTSNNLQFQLAVDGQTLADMDGLLYVQANQLNITPWIGRVLAKDDENTHSSINFDAWLSIDKGQASKLQIELGKNQIAWQHDQQVNTLNINHGQIIAQGLATPENFTIQSSELDVVTNGLQWRPVQFYAHNQASGMQANVTQLEIAGVIDLLPLFINQKSTQELLTKLSPTGVVNNLQFNKERDTLQLVAGFEEVNSEFSGGFPGINNVSGDIVLSGQQLNLHIEAHQGALDFDDMFKAPISYQTISSDIELILGNDGWQLTADNVEFISKELSLSAELGLFAQTDKPIEMALLATATKGNVVSAGAFYPYQLMGDDLVSYLNRALKKGQLEQAVVVVNGSLDEFPYKAGGGTFIVDAELTDATFSFDEAWQAIQHFDANLNFTDNSMLVTGRDGSLSGIDVTGVTASINDLSGEQVLEVKAQFSNTQPRLISHLMITSPLDNSVGVVLEKVQIENPVAGEFALTLPLDNVDATVAKGLVKLNDNIVKLSAPDMEFNKVNGEVHFNNELVSANNLNLEWRGMPLTLEIDGKELPKSYQTRINIEANWPEHTWLAQLPDNMMNYGKGTLNWQGQLDLFNSESGGFNYQFILNSDLIGTELALPLPYQKQADESMTTQVMVKGDQDSSTIDADISDNLQFYGVLNHQLESFSQAHLILGDEAMYLPLSGFHVTANLPQADLMTWQPFISRLVDSIVAQNSATDDTSPPLLTQPERIRGAIAQLDFIGESIHDVTFNLTDQVSWWQLDLIGKEAKVDIKFFPDWHEQGLEVKADFIHLAPDKQLFADSEAPAEQITREIDEAFNREVFGNFPPLRFNCQSCSYGNLSLGETSFIVERTSEQQLTVKNFIAKRKNSELMFDAKWLLDEKGSKTQVAGKYDSKNIEREFERLGLTPSIADSGLKATFDLNWIGAPNDVALAHLNGQAKAKLDEGVLREVPDKARGFSLLSLQTLVRKLRFDFRDMFSDGMFYSEISGDYQVKNGIIYTSNTSLKGSAGDLLVKGNTDLNSQSLDYKMTYKLNYSSNLPAIAWIATLNPVTFLAGVAIDGVITSRVPYELDYALTGSIDNPVFKEINRKSQNISVGKDTPPKVVENVMPEPAPAKRNSRINPETGLIEEDKHELDDKSEG